MSDERPARGAARVAATALAVLAMAAALVAVRAWLAELLIAPGAPAHQRRLAGPDPAGPGPVPGGTHDPIRVVIVDGLSRADAHGPALDRLCRDGLDLVVDVGFPTRSLPVQSVLWTGLTAQQTGVTLSNRAPPLAGALPARVPDSLAVVEAWTDIARAMGFARIEPPPASDRRSGAAEPGAVAAWRRDFERAALAAVTSSAPLVMIHVLRVDEAGHRGGRGRAYRDAIAGADQLLGRLRAAAPDARWLVLSDHGHRASGGHGGVEDPVRRVRACVDPRPDGAPAAGEVHLVDVAHHLHRWAGVTLPARHAGRPLAVALAWPDRDATLPRPPGAALLAAALLAGLGLALAAWRGRPRWGAAWPAAAAAAYLATAGLPTLSARSPHLAALCGAVAVALVLLPGAGGRRHRSRVIAVVAPGVAVALGAAVASGIPTAALGGVPARYPWWTAVAELAGTVAGLAILVGTGLVASGLRTPRGGRADVSGERTAGRGSGPGPGQPDGGARTSGVRKADGLSGRSDQAVRDPDMAGG